MDGKGTLMPANRGRLTTDQVRDLVPYVRAFGPSLPSAEGPLPESEFSTAFRQLERQWNELESQLQKAKGPQ